MEMMGTALGWTVPQGADLWTSSSWAAYSGR